MMYPIGKTYSVRELQRKYRTVLDAAKKSHEPVLLINNSAPEAVILDVETYNSLLNDTYIYDELRVKKAVQQARRSYRTGKAKKLKNWDELDA